MILTAVIQPAHPLGSLAHAESVAPSGAGGHSEPGGRFIFNQGWQRDVSGVQRRAGGPLAPALVAVTVLHAALLWWAATALSRPPEVVTPPKVVGQLVTQAPVTAPEPLPMRPQPPKPRPAPRPEPVPAPPAPQAPPSERAVTAPPAEPPAPEAPVAAMADPAPAAPAPAPSAPVAPEPATPVIPPRSDAAHLSNPVPVYPVISRRLGEQGRVLLDVYILADGSVGELRLRRSSGYPRLDEAALAAVRHWRYVPARRGDQPIPYWYVQPLDFSMRP